MNEENKYAKEAKTDSLTQRGLRVGIQRQMQKVAKAQEEFLINLCNAEHIQDVQSWLNSYNYYKSLNTQLNLLLLEFFGDNG